MKSCYFVFPCFVATDDKRNICVHGISQLKHNCFLPWGFTERLIGRSVKWCQLRDLNSKHEPQQLYKSHAILLYNLQLFRLVCIPELNCIRLDIEGEHPLPVYNRICEEINICVKECMGSLQFITMLPMDEASESDYDRLKLLDLRVVEKYLTMDTTARFTVLLHWMVSILPIISVFGYPTL